VAEVEEGMDRASVVENESVFLSASGEVFVHLGADDRCERVVCGGAAATPVDFGRWLGLSVQECFTSESCSKLARALERSRAAATATPLHFEVAVPGDQGKDVGPRLFEATIVRQDSARHILALRDVTDRRETSKLEAHLAHDEMLEALGILAGSIAHDFNNLLVSITSFTELAVRTSFDARMNEYVEAILAAVRRGRDLTRGLSTFARGGELTLRPIELDPLLHEIAQTLRALRPEGEVTVTVHAANARVLGDASQIHRALLNVGKNAVDAVRAHPEAKIALSLDVRRVAGPEAGSTLPIGSYVVLSVEDEGSGMDEATLARLFDPFFTRKAPGEGTGLGLSVVHGIVHAHGGDVRVTSAPGQGTVFVIELPLLDRAGQSTFPKENRESAAPDPSAQGTQRPRLLVVDDDPNVGRSLALLLETLGYEVVLERSPVAALELARTAEAPFDLVLTDLGMTELDGLALAQEIAELERPCPVVLVSGQETRASREAFRNGGVAALLAKPFMLNELEATLAPLLKPRVGTTSG
jgi:signal transduction histidine kinase/ActR/RegA family two-component response regulator